MKRIDLQPQEHNVKVGDVCGDIEPNVTEDSIFYFEGEPVGFYIRELPRKASELAKIADKEFRSKNVPKSKMNRTSTLKGSNVQQYSTIIGSIAPKERMGRYYKTMSKVHSVKKAQTFIKAMLLLAKESEKIISEIMPEQYKRQKEIFERVPEEWKFGNIFTSSISNYNIPAPFHQDRANIKGTVNAIITKRKNSKGGNLHVPDYNATIEQSDNSLLVYPAWRNLHGVTPIRPTVEGGYRNSLVFYPLAAFEEKDYDKK